jgi:hypothetical protein
MAVGFAGGFLFFGEKKEGQTDFITHATHFSTQTAILIHSNTHKLGLQQGNLGIYLSPFYAVLVYLLFSLLCYTERNHNF